jgi:hypothetical protein
MVHAGVALGLACAAIDAFIEIANRREITIAALGGQRDRGLFSMISISYIAGYRV